MNDTGQPDDFEDQMLAPDGSCKVGVHVLSEFIFCRRAGLIEYESRHEDSGVEDEALPRLDYLPDFSIDMIEWHIQKEWSDIWRMLTFCLPVVATIGILGHIVHRMIWIGLAVVICWMLPVIFRRLQRVAGLAAQLRAAENATPNEPIADSPHMQPVNWWELLNAGFQAVEYEDPHEVLEWNLVGGPWRVLVKGSLRIPVFRKSKGDKEVHSQQRARIAAYCMLLEEVEGGESPYGIVLFGHEHDGVTIPNTQSNRDLVADGLVGLRQMIANVAGGMMLDIPRPANVCRRCPKGKPRVIKPQESETQLDGVVLTPYSTRSKGNELFHCTCGDRFRWVPPHENASELELLG